MDFSAALERAIDLTKRRSLEAMMLWAGGALALSALNYFMGGRLWHSVVGIIAALLSVLYAFGSTAATRTLESLRGSTPEHWLPSSSHGVVVLAGNVLIAGAHKAALDRHARERIVSISFDEDSHALTIDLIKVVKHDGGEREDQRRTVAKIDPSISTHEGLAFAKRVLDLSQH
jgi:hypothetical protein